MIIRYLLLGDKKYEGASLIRGDYLQLGFNETNGMFWIKCNLSRELFFQCSSKKGRDQVFHAILELLKNPDNPSKVNLWPFGMLEYDAISPESNQSLLTIKPNLADLAEDDELEETPSIKRVL